MGKTFSGPIQTALGAQLSSCAMDADYFLGIKRPECGVYHLNIIERRGTARLPLHSTPPLITGQSLLFLPFRVPDLWRTLIGNLKAASSLERWLIIYQSSQSHVTEHLNLPVTFVFETSLFHIVSTRMIDPKMSMQILTVKVFNVFTKYLFFFPHCR